jgi:hypothetical protein
MAHPPPNRPVALGHPLAIAHRLQPAEQVVRAAGGPAIAAPHTHPIALAIVGEVGRAGGVRGRVLPVEEAPLVVVAELGTGLRPRAGSAAGGSTAGHVPGRAVAGGVGAANHRHRTQVRVIPVGVAATRRATAAPTMTTTVINVAARPILPGATPPTTTRLIFVLPITAALFSVTSLPCLLGLALPRVLHLLNPLKPISLGRASK